MTELADRTIAALRGNHEDLAARVRGYGEADLARGSGCSDWEVAAVLSHLGSGAEIMQATLQAALAGDEPPGGEFNQSVWDRWNAMSPAEQAAGFLAGNERAVGALEGLDGTARDELTVNMGFLPAPASVELFAGMRLNEAAMHAWDVRVAFDPEAELTGEEPGTLLDQQLGPLEFLLGWLAKADALAGPAATAAALRVETTDPERSFALVLRPGIGLRSDADDAVGADGVLSGPSGAFLRLLSGRVDAAHTPATLRVDSDAVTLDTLCAVFPGY